MEYLLDFALLLEFICFAVALYTYKKYKQSRLQLVSIYLFLVVLVESVSYFLRTEQINNQMIYNVLGLAELLLFSSVFLSFIQDQFFKKVIKILVVACLFVLLINGIFFTSPMFLQYLNFGFSTSSIVITIVILIYFFELLNSEKILYLKEILAFWIGIGLLFYHVGNLPITILGSYLESNLSTQIILLVQVFCNILMYGCFMIGFLISKQKHNYA